MRAATRNELAVFWTRIALILVMMGSALGLNALGALSLIWPALVLTTIGYIALCWARLVLSPRTESPWPGYAQITIDIAWISVFVRLTGGTENNPYALLFFLAIIAASNARFVRGAIYAATVASAGYAGLLWLDLRALQRVYGISARAELPPAFSASFYLNACVYAICFYLVAAFSGYLAERVRLKGRQLEQAAQALEDFRLSTGDILEKMGSGLLTLTGAGNIKYCNVAGCAILGLDAAAILDRNIARSFVQGLEPLREVLGSELAGNSHRAVRREIIITRPDGSDIPIGISTTPIRDGDVIHGLIAVFQDLTEVRQNERRLLEIEQLESTRELTTALLSLIKPEVKGIDEALNPILEGKVDSRAAQSLAILIKQRIDTIIKTVDDYIRFARIELAGQPQQHDPGQQSETIIGQSPEFQQVMDLLRQIAPSDSTVLIYGESGTGKELLARELHRLSHRSQGPFVCINCAALPETLLESELFGHVRGSFTGAVRDKEGLFRVADGGTVFLDEVSETSPAIQVKLLRVLQEREIVPVGGTRPIKVDVRLISATNIDLPRAVEQGSFRTDLFYRINVIPIQIPPLRQRRGDIAVLAEHFLRKVSRRDGTPAKRLSQAARDALQAYRWPGNVRELENVIERAVILAPSLMIEPSHVPAAMIAAAPGTGGPAAGRPAAVDSGTLKVRERQAIITALEECEGNKTRAAKKLGIHYATLYRKMKQYDIK